MHIPFTVGSLNPIVGQPTVVDNFLYVRSSQTEGGGNIAVALTGLDDTSAPYGETVTLLATKGQVEIATTGYFSLIRSINAGPEGIVSVYAFGTAGIGYVIAETQPADATTLTFGLTGFTKVYTFQTVLTNVDGHVLRGADATASILNLKNAMILGAGSGTTYAAATTVNPYLSASASGTVLTITDRIACHRQLAWSFAQSSTHFSLPATLSCGVDGVLIGRVDSGGLGPWAFNPITFSTEDLANNTLPALLAPTTDWILLNGKSCVLQFKCSNVVTPIPLKYQTSTDQINASDGVTSITSLDNNTVASPQRVVPSERCIEYIRLVFASNANTTDSALDSRVILPLV